MEKLILVQSEKTLTDIDLAEFETKFNIQLPAN